jgi:hypothetical protein
MRFVVLVPGKNKISEVEMEKLMICGSNEVNF